MFVSRVARSEPWSVEFSAEDKERLALEEEEEEELEERDAEEEAGTGLEEAT